MKTKIKIFALAIFIVVYALLLLTVADVTTNLPDVYKSYSSKQCTKVVRPDGSSGSCSKLPAKYHLVWVE